MSVLAECVAHCSLLITYELLKGATPSELDKALDDLAEVYGDLVVCAGNPCPA